MRNNFNARVLLAILITTSLIPSKALAQTEVECPDTWKVNSESEFNEKYRALDLQLRNKYKGLNHFEKHIVKWHWIFDSGGENLEIFPPPMVQWVFERGGPNEKIFTSNQEGPNWSSWGAVMAMVAPKTPISLFYEITVQDCPNIAKFSYPVYIPEPNIKRVSLDNWGSETQLLFNNESALIKYKEKIMPLLEKVKKGEILKGFRSPNTLVKKNPKLKTVPYELGLFSPTFTDSYPYITYLLPSQSKCVIFEAEDNIGVPIGKDCMFAVVLIDSKSFSEKSRNPRAKLDIFLLDEFSFKINAQKTTLNCIKGKLTKK